jgi:hypothetical protein
LGPNKSSFIAPTVARQVSASSADNSGRGSGRRMATIGTTDNDAALSPPLCPFMTDILPASVGADIVLFVNAMINVTRFALSCH